MFAAVYGVELFSWGLIGNAARNGQLAMGWMTAWVLLVLSLVLLRLLGGWLNSTFALDASRILKKRMLAGALKLDIESVLHQGAGQWLARVMESQALQSLAVNGGLSVMVATLELIQQPVHAMTFALRPRLFSEHFLQRTQCIGQGLI
jgi:ATP-binding cassette, subfamily B, bacterial